MNKADKRSLVHAGLGILSVLVLIGIFVIVENKGEPYTTIFTIIFVIVLLFVILVPIYNTIKKRNKTK